jgi:beta-galactosidase
VWKIPFSPGTLKAVAKHGGRIVASDELRTVGKPARIHLECRNPRLGSSSDDVAIVRAIIVDAEGVPVPRADDVISFNVSGPGMIVAVDNGDNDSHEPFRATSRRAYNGTCAAFIKSTGQSKMNAEAIKLTATAAGLQTGSITLSLANGMATTHKPEGK